MSIQILICFITIIKPLSVFYLYFISHNFLNVKSSKLPSFETSKLNTQCKGSSGNNVFYSTWIEPSYLPPSVSLSLSFCFLSSLNIKLHGLKNKLYYIYLCVCVCMCAHVCACTHARTMVYLWKPEDNVWKLVCFFTMSVLDNKSLGRYAWQASTFNQQAHLTGPQVTV